MSQLGALRSVLSRLKDFSDANKAIAWLSVKGRQEKWHSESLKLIHDYLTKQKDLTKEDLIWTVLKLDVNELTITTKGVNALKQELWTEAIYAFFDACIRARKRTLELKADNS